MKSFKAHLREKHAAAVSPHGIAMDQDEKKEVINEANKIYDVEKVLPSIYLAAELSRNKL